MTSTLHTAAEQARRFFLWWGEELADLVPPALRSWAAREGRRTVLALDDGRLVHYQEKNGHPVRRGEFPGSSPTPWGRGTTRSVVEGADKDAAVAAPSTAFLGSSPRTGPPPPQAGEEAGEAGPQPGSLPRRGPVGLRLPHGACLVRRLDLPAAARRDLAQILRLDLERSTPFRPDEVYFDHVLEEERRDDGKIGVRQVVAKRSTVDPVLAELAARGVAVDFVDCWDEEGKRGLPVDLLRSREAQTEAGAGRRLRPAAVLALCALVLAGSAVTVTLGKHEAALARLEAQSAAARAEALAVRRSLDGTEAALAELGELRRLKAERPMLVAIIDELARILPDEAWVRYLKVEGDVVDVTIVAPRTAELLPLLGRSSMFGAASLAAPVTYDEAGDSERAAVRMRLRPPAQEVGAAAAGGSPG